ncbi:putative UDP-N-acetylglucosamine--peptide N-acetylglucosaminyltransferase SEC [Grifola frondosa]|uniref:protein O-GlcNAc transferase n=1 Tax=Grifola frondosa TaxID=5627 RepID=A0A1C7MSH5_GRIFR|nr:putative UDP-N-acetylglucosamine--peptide N-acetylglucosaminyltransferase SEC [Grifola frondosa]
MGSLLKDQGQTDQAIMLYLKAIEHKPDFDIALANLGNAIKDVGRAWDAIEFYRRAVDINPDLPEAVCGLANSLCSVCDWRGRGGFAHDIIVDDDGDIVYPGHAGVEPHLGWMTKMVDVTGRQLQAVYTQAAGMLETPAALDDWLHALAITKGRLLRTDEREMWLACFRRLCEHRGEQVNDAGFIIRFVDWLQPRLQRRWYIRAYGNTLGTHGAAVQRSDNLSSFFLRPTLPGNITLPLIPSVLPFHTFTYPLSPRANRLIAHRNALRISYVALTQPWLPKHVFHPPRPPVRGRLNIGYISNDVNNHPLSHLMQSIFGMHDREQFSVYLYTTSPWDGTAYRPAIASMVEHFIEVSSWSLNAIIEHILEHEIHILINLGGYTRGARNDIFAARPCPIQMQLMGYAGTIGAGWCDYLVCDPISCPQDMSAVEQWRKVRRESRKELIADGHYHLNNALDLDADLDPEGDSVDWLYMEKFMYMPHTFMVTDHKQSFHGDENLTPDERAKISVEILWLNEEKRRAEMRQKIFADLPQDTIIFANFNQLYKIDPSIFATWLHILHKVPRSVLWLLRFPAAGEEHLLRTAKSWAGEEVASRIRFTEVARKEEHIYRGRVADLFLDTVECNAHTITADVLWTGTPVLTWPKHAHKMCSRVAASMANATGFGDQMIVRTIEEYESRAVALANSVRYVPVPDQSGKILRREQGELMELRRNLFLNRDTMPLFDTVRWTRNLEKGLREAWRRWVEGTQYELSDEWNACEGPEKESGCIWVLDNEPTNVVRFP